MAYSTQDTWILFFDGNESSRRLSGDLDFCLRLSNNCIASEQEKKFISLQCLAWGYYYGCGFTIWHKFIADLIDTELAISPWLMVEQVERLSGQAPWADSNTLPNP